MDLSPWQFAATVIGTGGVTSTITALLNWKTQRAKEETVAKSAVEEAARELMESAMASARSQMERLETEVKTLRQELAETREQHANDVASLRDRHKRCEEETAELKAQIDELMKQPVAGYQSIRRVTPRKAG